VEHRRRRQSRLAPRGVGGIGAQQLLQHQPLRPAVGHQMVLRPHELVDVLRQLEERHAQQRRLGDLEPARAIGRQEAGQPLPLLRRGEVPPGGALHVQIHFPESHLARRFHVLPEKRRAQDGVPRDEGAPGSFEGWKIEVSGQPQAHLEHVHARARGHQAVKEHRVLHRRQLVKRFDVVGIHPSPIPFESLTHPRFKTYSRGGDSTRIGAASNLAERADAFFTLNDSDDFESSTLS